MLVVIREAGNGEFIYWSCAEIWALGFARACLFPELVASVQPFYPAVRAKETHVVGGLSCVRGERFGKADAAMMLAQSTRTTGARSLPTQKHPVLEDGQSQDVPKERLLRSRQLFFGFV